MERRDSAGYEGNDGGRRRFLAAVGAGAVGATAGCLGGLMDGSDGGGGGGGNNSTDVAGQIGSGRSPFGNRGPPGGTSMQEMPDLKGKLTLYSGRGQALVGELIGFIENLYDGFEVKTQYGGSTELVQQIQTEGKNSPADVFYSVNAGSLGMLSEAGRTTKLPKDVLTMVDERFHDPQGKWVGTSGRARSVPFNTNAFDERAIPNDIFAFPNQKKFDGKMGWAPSYGSFQAFVTAMRLLNGRQKTKQWLQAMKRKKIVKNYSDEFLVAQAVARGEIKAGFTNHYYIQRVLAGNKNASIGTAFTKNDAGSMFNVAGAAVVNTTGKKQLASNFVRHLLSAEAQEYFAVKTYEYPLIPEVQPLGRLPTIDELEPPANLDLGQLSKLKPTLDLLREVGLL
ncbi:extracellular solute-binding protein [Halomicrococcus sp. NG-SE-24]|uniref:extracellular solute-binding protein n=1 Tax=Halomicrococcus sp. NG-SE-24 TaxID=3436928 RepID=UPI003D97F51F